MTTDNVNQPGVGAAAETPSEQDNKSGYGAAAASSPENTGQNGTAVAVEPMPAPAPVETATESSAAPGTAQATSLAPAEHHTEPSSPLESAAEAPAESGASPSGAEAGSGQDFGTMLDSYEKESAASIQEGEVVRGIVVDVSDQNVLVDIGYKSEGVVPREELTGRDSKITVKPGDQIDVLIKSLENQDGYAVLSRADAVRVKAWDKLRLAHQNHETVTGRVVDRIKGGLKVDVDGVIAFLPGSQVDVRPIRNLEAFRGQDIEARVIKLNRKRGNVVLSRKQVLEESSSKKKSETLTTIEEGVIMEGTVKSLTEYGAFVDLGGIDGLLHITDMSWSRIQSPNELFKVGDPVQVKVLKFDREKERISLGYKQLIPDPWQSVAERYPKEAKVRGKVVSLTDYGAFVEIEPGIEGLVHVTEMTWSKRLKHPSKLLSIGQEVEAVVLDVDQTNRRISLGIKQVEQDPWETLPARYHL
ncbi:MAG TPA: 30S ribosomal protein S1, partial [Blastocatellia bacterium]